MLPLRRAHGSQPSLPGTMPSRHGDALPTTLVRAASEGGEVTRSGGCCALSPWGGRHTRRLGYLWPASIWDAWFLEGTCWIRCPCIPGADQGLTGQVLTGLVGHSPCPDLSSWGTASVLPQLWAYPHPSALESLALHLPVLPPLGELPPLQLLALVLVLVLLPVGELPPLQLLVLVLPPPGELLPPVLPNHHPPATP
jgi:hypothetical protein